MKDILGKMSIGDVVSFELLVTTIIRTDYSNVKIEGIVPAKLAGMAGDDAYTLHAQVYRLLPPGTVEDNAESYQYLIVGHPNGETSIVGIPWIDVGTIRVHHKQRTKFIVEDMAQEDIEQVSKFINRLGYTPVLENSRF